VATDSASVVSLKTTDARTSFIDSLRSAITDEAFLKLTLSRYVGSDKTIKSVSIRPVLLKAGHKFSFVWRHQTNDITKNLSAEEALQSLTALIGTDFLDAHLFIPGETLQLECKADGSARLSRSEVAYEKPILGGNDREKNRIIKPTSTWLEALGITSSQGRPKEGMASKFKQIQKFSELLSDLLREAGLDKSTKPLKIIDMGSGKGYLTFSIAELLKEKAHVTGIELRPELVELGNSTAQKTGLASHLTFKAGAISSTPNEAMDVLIALHACDTATDDALAQAVAAKASLIIVSPCCQKELRSQLKSPEVLAASLRHGIFQERQSEFVTDALRALLLEWAGYKTKVFEFISTEHTSKNLMITAIKHSAQKPEIAPTIRAFAQFYGISHQSLAKQLGFSLQSIS
jgi:SAM-dependent methyltransferase